MHCAAGLTLGLTVQAIVGLIQYFTRAHLGLDLLGETGTIAMDSLANSTVRDVKVFRVGAFLSHPNVFGIFLAALLPIAIGAFLLRISKGYKLYFLSAACLGMAALIATLSRSGWVSFAAAFLLLMTLMIFHRGLRQRSLLAAGAACAALITVSAIFARQIIDRIFESRVDAMLGRAEYIHDAWGMIKAQPWLGFGLNSYVLAVPPFTQYGAQMANFHYKGWIPPVHNIYLLWWAETGIIGLVIHLALLGGIVWMGLRNLKVKDEMLFTLNAACLAGILAFLVDGFFSFSLRFNSILRVFWVLAGMIMAVHYCHLRQAQYRTPSEPGGLDGLQEPNVNGNGTRCNTPVYS
jgi:O-antigen ligase